jgi:hypothetical protein
VTTINRSPGFIAGSRGASSREADAMSIADVILSDGLRADLRPSEPQVRLSEVAERKRGLQSGECRGKLENTI